MSFEGLPQQPKKVESETPVYRIAELKKRLASFETQRNQGREAMRKREISMDVFGEKLAKIDQAEKFTREELEKEKERISPEDRELLEMLVQEKENLNFHQQGFDGLLKRYRGMQDFNGNPRPDIDREEYNKVRSELIQVDSDLKKKREELVKKTEDLVRRGLIDQPDVGGL